MTLTQAYAELVREIPHVRKVPSSSFVAVLRALAVLGRSYGYVISRHAGVDDQATGRLLYRMYRLGLVNRERETGDRCELGRALRVYYELTPAGQRLAAKIATGAP